MINPATMMKLMSAKNKFTENHPKAVAFISNVFGTGIPVDTIIEVTVTKPGESPMTTNLKVKESDLELFQQMKDLAR